VKNYDAGAVFLGGAAMAALWLAAAATMPPVPVRRTAAATGAGHAWHTWRQTLRRKVDMASVNKVIIVGNLGKDPEVRYTPNGEAVTNVTIATTDTWKDKDRREAGGHRVASRQCSSASRPRSPAST
jgi:hypothetical protein